MGSLVLALSIAVIVAALPVWGGVAGLAINWVVGFILWGVVGATVWAMFLKGPKRLALWSFMLTMTVPILMSLVKYLVAIAA